MFGIDLISLVVGIALGATFSAFFKMVWSNIKTSPIYVKIMSFFGGSSNSTPVVDKQSETETK